MADAPASPGGGGGGVGAGSHDSGENSPRSNFREQDRFLPIANIGRIMKKVLPANGKVAKDAKETMQECVSEFISFITSEASDKCQKEKRKTINGDDLLWAMATLGFEDYIDPLKTYLARYREIEGDTKGLAKGGDSSARRDVLPNPNAQLAHQGSFSQGSFAQGSFAQGSFAQGSFAQGSFPQGSFPQGSFPQGVNYSNSQAQAQAQHMMFPHMQGPGQE